MGCCRKRPDFYRFFEPVEQVSNWSVLRTFPWQVWVCFVLHFLDGFAYFSLSTNLTIYLTTEHQISDIDAGLYYSVWGALLVILGLPSGAIIDKLGIKWSLIVGAGFNTMGRIVFAMSATLWVQLAALFIGTTVGAGFFISTLHIAVKRYTKGVAARSVAFSFLYWAMNIGAIAAMLSTDLALDSEVIWQGYQLLFVVAAVVSLVTFVISIYFHELPTRVESPTVKECLGVFREKPFYKLLGFNVSLIPVRAIFRYGEALLPIYLVRVYPGISYGAVLAINPLCIIVLTPIVGLLSKRISFVYGFVVLGTLVSALAFLTAISWHELSAVVVALIIFTLGEAIYSPKSGQYTLEHSPRGKEGLYSGLITIPYFAGNAVAGEFSGWLLDTYCPARSDSTETTEFDLAYAQECSNVWAWIVGSALLTPLLLILLYRLLRFRKTELQRQLEMDRPLNDSSSDTQS